MLQQLRKHHFAVRSDLPACQLLFLFTEDFEVLQVELLENAVVRFFNTLLRV